MTDQPLLRIESDPDWYRRKVQATRIALILLLLFGGSMDGEMPTEFALHHTLWHSAIALHHTLWLSAIGVGLLCYWYDGFAVTLQADQATYQKFNGRVVKRISRSGTEPFRVVPSDRGDWWTLVSPDDGGRIFLPGGAFPALVASLQADPNLGPAYILDQRGDQGLVPWSDRWMNLTLTTMVVVLGLSWALLALIDLLLIFRDAVVSAGLLWRGLS